MDKDAVVRLTQQLVAMSSENPGSSEKEIAAFVADWFGDMASVSARVHEVRPGRPNVVARLRGNGSAPPVVLLAHMDTVPRGEGWRHDPFAGTIEDGKLYGRGACDMKGGLAVVMRVIRNLAIAGGERRRDVLLCATMDEEGLGMLGINDLIDRGVVDKHSLVICTEPTDLELVIAHKGVVWYEVKTEGKSCHAGNPELGIDAISAMGEIVCALKRKVGSLPHEHPLVGRSSIAFGRVEGGFKTNVVSDHCRLEVDIRIVPPMTIPELTAMVEETARGAAAVVPGARVSVQHINTDRPPVEADVNSELVGAVVDSFRRVTGREVVKSGFRAYTDASVVSARTGNTTSVLFGPGRLAEAHTIDEYVPVDHLVTAEAVLTQAVDRLCR